MRGPEASRAMSEPDTNKSEIRDGQRIAKAMARAGLCSRRDAEAWIEAGRVSVNGAILESPAFNVGPDDDVRVDGEPLRAPERTRLFFFHKPRGLVTTARDPEGRRTIFEALPKISRASSRSANSTSTPRVCCCSPTTAGSRAYSSSPPPVG